MGSNELASFVNEYKKYDVGINSLFSLFNQRMVSIFEKNRDFVILLLVSIKITTRSNRYCYSVLRIEAVTWL